MKKLTVHNLSCSRGGRVIFCKVSFSVHSNQMLILKGCNGSGKTTLLRALSGLLDPSGGCIQWPINSSIFFLDHKSSLKSRLTLYENLQFWRAIYNASPLQIEIALEIFHLGHLKNLPVQILSLGQKQRLSLCRLLLSPAEIWCLDEPLCNLDQQAKKSLKMLLEKHQNKGGMIIMSSHDDMLYSQKNSVNLDDYQL
jgi:heme exporter protein A